MSNYTQTTFFAPKDTLLSGDPLKKIKGAQIDPELAAIAVAIATKLDSSSAANPTGTIGLAAVNGAATTYMRSDAAPALSQSIVPTWTAVHTFSATPVFNAGFTANATSTVVAAGAALTIKGGASGAANQSYIQFVDSGAVRKGYVGDANAADSDIYLESDSGNIKLVTSSTTTAAQTTPDAGVTYYDIGWRDAPQNVQNGAYTTVMADRGKSIVANGAGGNTLTIAANASVPYPLGTTLVFANRSSANISIAINSDTLIIAGTSTTGTRTLSSNNGLATAIKTDATVWLISGSGLT